MEENKESQENLQEKREQALWRLHEERTEEALWDCVVAFQEFEFHTYSGLPYSYHMKYGRSGTYTKELWIDRREKVKALSGVPSGLRIIRCWNCRKKVQDQLSIARRIWGISAELRISTGFFTRSGCWKCRRRQKRNSPCRRRYKKRRKNKVSANAGLDNH